MHVMLLELIDKIISQLNIIVINILAICITLGTLGLIGFAIAKNALSLHIKSKEYINGEKYE